MSAKPHHNLGGQLVDPVHMADLLTLLCQVVLINANGVYPK
jgi:hypothetical protein